MSTKRLQTGEKNLYLHKSKDCGLGGSQDWLLLPQ